MSRRLTAAVGAVLVLATVGCGGKAKVSRPKPSAPAPVTNASPFNLEASDLPAGWTVVLASGGSTAGASPVTAALFSCLHLPISQRRELSDVASDTFGAGQTLRAASNVTAVSPATLPGQEVAALRAPGGLPCLGLAIGRSVAAQGAGVSNARIQAIPVPGARTDPSVGAHYSATFTEAGKSIEATADEYVIAHGDDEITVTFTAFEAVFPAAVEQNAVQRLLGRASS